MSNHIIFSSHRGTDNDVCGSYQKYFPSIKLKEPKKAAKHVPNWMWIWSITFGESRHGELKKKELTSHKNT